MDEEACVVGVQSKGIFGGKKGQLAGMVRLD